MGNGKGTSFLLESWIDDGPLKAKFPRLFALEENEQVTVFDKIYNGIHGFRRMPGFIGCSTLSMLFIYLGVKVGGLMSRLSSWDYVIAKLSSRLSKWKLKTLSIGGCLTLIKSVLSSLPLYHISIFKVPMNILYKMKATRRKIFNGVENSDKSISLIRWKNILASKKNALEIFLENLLRLISFDDIWLADSPLKALYPRLYYLDLDKQSSVATKLRDSSLISSFRRPPRGGIEEEQLKLLVESTSSIIFPQISDR
ncbi:hypothetical protein Tco_0743491 [Tanacetum coccineum]